MFPSTLRYLGRRSVTNVVAFSQEKIKIDLRKVMFPSAFRYLSTRLVTDIDEVPTDKLLNEWNEESGIWDDQITRPLTVALRFDKLLSHLVRLKEYPKDMASSLSREIDDSEISVSDSTLNYVFNCYCLSRRLRIDFGLSILGRMFKKDCVPNEVLTYASKWDDVRAMLKENRTCETKEIFKKIVREKSCGIDVDAVTYGTLIHGLCKEGHSMIAVEVLRTMTFGRSQLDAQTLNMIIEGWYKEHAMYKELEYFYNIGSCKENDVYCALKSFYTMLRKDLVSGGYIYDDLIRGLCDMSLNCKVYRDVWTKRIESEVKDVLGAMMYRYCSQGQLRKAKKVFQFMDRTRIFPNMACYCTLINGYLKKKKNIVYVMQLYNEMCSRGFRPRLYTYNSILQQLFSNGRCSDALQIFDELQAFGPKPDYSIYCSMLRGLCRNGQVERASLLLNAVELEGEPLHFEYYDIVINGFSEDGQFGRANDVLFKKGRLKLVLE